MALKKAEKSKIVEEFASRFRKQKIAIFSVFHGISVAKATTLRRMLKKNDAELKIAKKTLLDRALDTAGIKIRTRELTGEISVTFGYGDEATPAKTLSKFSRENETFKIVGGILGSRILSDKEVLALAKLPGREVLLAQLARTLQFPIQGLATVLAGNMRNLVVVLNKIKDNK